MHYPYVMYEHRSLSSLCMSLFGYRVCDRAVYLARSVEPTWTNIIFLAFVH